MKLRVTGYWCAGLLLVCLAAYSQPVMGGGNRLAISATARGKPRVAIFSQAGFPYYMVSPLISPRNIVSDLSRVGIAADLLDAAALASPQKFNASRYSALVLPYGNTFPRDAFRNLRQFHAAGGCLILSGVPFTHPSAQIGAAGWEAHPGWGGDAHRTEDAHSGQHALELRGRTGEWAGVNSPRTPLKGQSHVVVSGWSKDVSGTDGGDDWLYVRFYDRAGNFLSQQGPPITPGSDWHLVSETLQVPEGAAALDISPQIRTARRTVRLDDLQLERDRAIVPLANGGFETPDGDWTDLGHSSAPALFGPDGIGAGGFSSPTAGNVGVANPDVLGLGPMRAEWEGRANLQSLDTASLPRGTLIVPALTLRGRPISAIIDHTAGPFPSAVDVWTLHREGGDWDAYLEEQLLVRGTVEALFRKGLLSAPMRMAAYISFNHLPPPTRYVNLILPSPPRPYRTFQPKMPPPSQHLFVADVSTLGRDERLLLLSLQGLVNRVQPRIYLVFGRSDRFWLDEMQRQGQTGTPIPVPDPLSLLRKFRTSFRGAVTPDPKVYLTPDVAASAAGADDLVIASPALAKRLQIPITLDLRGKFADDAAALRYIRTTLWPRLNPYVSLCLDPAILDSGAIDQIIAARGAVFWVTGIKAQSLPGAAMAAELKELKALLAQMPLNAVVRGFWWHGDGQGLDEGPGVSLGSRFGKVTVVSDYVANFSVFSGVLVTKLKQKPHPPAPVLDPSKVYVAITISDGDNLCTWRDYFRSYFNDPAHGLFPVGWGMGPGLIDDAPTWAKWYYEHATPTDEFLCDVSGAGYIYPPDWAAALKDRPGTLRSFYGWTQKYMNRMDMKTIRLMNVGVTDIAEVGRDLPGVAFLMPDYGYSGEHSYGEFTYTLPTGQPVFRAITSGSGPQTLADQVRSRVGATRPAFANVFIWNWGSKLSDLKKMLDLLGPGYVAVTPSQLNELYRQHKSGFPPIQRTE